MQTGSKYNLSACFSILFGLLMPKIHIFRAGQHTVPFHEAIASPISAPPFSTTYPLTHRQLSHCFVQKQKRLVCKHRLRQVINHCTFLLLSNQQLALFQMLIRQKVMLTITAAPIVRNCLLLTENLDSYWKISRYNKSLFALRFLVSQIN